MNSKSLDLANIIQTALQAGILFTLLGCAYQVGLLVQKFDMKIEDHENRIGKIEKVYPLSLPKSSRIKVKNPHFI